jgi:long-chain acyl-CoA synthetase
VVRDTLIDFFLDLAQARGNFLVYDDGFSTRAYTYEQMGGAARAFSARVRDAGLRKGDHVVVWSENRPEWIVAFWGCLLSGVVVVPIDYRASPDFLVRVSRIVAARLILIGNDVPPLPAQIDAPIWKLPDVEWIDAAATAVTVARDDVAEIIFTSGATADPKGVVITHGNVLANTVPIEREVTKYRKWGRPFFPLRFLNLLPLSHMFGQAMATFVPPMLPGVVVFMRGYNPGEIVTQIKKRRVSVLVSVPKILDVLREQVMRGASPAERSALERFAERRLRAERASADAEAPADRRSPGGGWPASHAEARVTDERAEAGGSQPNEHVALRWWRYRRIHRLFGLKFWAFVVGAAPLDAELEAFWKELGFVVVQGYGLTETAPIVSLNHPFNTRKGSVGKAIAGVEVKIAEDGEILVRGENVTRGYFKADAETARAFEGGWFHTGDVGEVAADGQIYIRGRKKEMIVTPEGLNVFPEDVERVLNRIAGVRDSAVVGVPIGAEERVHAVLVLDGGVDEENVVRQTNALLEDHQKIRRALIWPEPELPRTEGTRKLKRAAIREWVKTGSAPQTTASAGDRLADLIAKYAGRTDLPASTTIEELGLSSLDRVELMVALEDAFQARIDETAFAEARDLGQLRSLLQRSSTADAAPADPVDFPAWNRAWPARTVRRVSLPTWILPLARVFAWLSVEGLEHLASIDRPVVFAANHQSHMDAPVILAALPARLRYRLATAMAKEFFKPHFYPAQHRRLERLTNSLNYYLATLFFNAFPLPQREAGARQTLRYIGDVLADGFSVLIFPEGRRSETGEIDRFRPGIGMIASRLRVPVVPVRLKGLENVLAPSWWMARPGRVRVVFGPPLQLSGDDYAALAAQVEQAVRTL